MIFELADRRVLTDPASFEGIITWAFRLVRDFVDLYRAFTQDIDVVPPTEDDIALAQPWVTDDYVWSAAGPGAVSFNALNPTFRWRRLERTWEGKRTLTTNLIDARGSAPRQGAVLPQSDQFFLDSKEQAHQHRRFEVSIVLSATGLETFLRETLREACIAGGVTTLPGGGKDAGGAVPFEEGSRRVFPSPDSP